MTDSWNWKCILRLRCLAVNFVKCVIGNGRRASFWFDNWTIHGPLFNYIGLDGPRTLRVPLNATVSDACGENGWNLADPRSDNGVNLHAYLTTITLPSESSENDTYDWVVENKSCNGFSSSRTWSVLRPRANGVDWCSSIWFKGAIPRHAFNMWTANLDRLPTKTRLASWGMNIDTLCGLCSSQQECRDHLFLSCDFAQFIWHQVSLRLHLPRIALTTWSNLLSWVRTKHSRSPPTLRKLVAQSVVYHLWKQRNNLLHNQVYILPSQIFRDIDREMKNTITARQPNKRFRNLMRLWLR